MREIGLLVFLLLLVGLLLVSACAQPAPGKEVAPLPAPKGEVAPLPAPKGEVAPLPAPGKEVAPLPAPKGEVAPLPAPKGEVATALDAKKLYDVSCAVCHGPNRQGISGLGPPLTPASLARLSDDEIRNTILKGRPNTAMVGFEGRLSAEEINSLIQLIKYSSP